MLIASDTTYFHLVFYDCLISCSFHAHFSLALTGEHSYVSFKVTFVSRFYMNKSFYFLLDISTVLGRRPSCILIPLFTWVGIPSKFLFQVKTKILFLSIFNHFYVEENYIFTFFRLQYSISNMVQWNPSPTPVGP